MPVLWNTLSALWYIGAHLAVDHVGDAGVGALTRLGPDHHVSSVDSRAGPQQLLQQHL